MDGPFVFKAYTSDDGAHAIDYRVIVVQLLPPDAAANAQRLDDEHAAHGRMKVVALKHAASDTGVTYSVAPTGTKTPRSS